MASAPGEPPGSRVSTTPRPWALRRPASRVAWVDFPVPSPPSNVMKRPRMESQPSIPGDVAGEAMLKSLTAPLFLCVACPRARSDPRMLRCARDDSRVGGTRRRSAGMTIARAVPQAQRLQTFGAGPEQTDDQLAGCIEGALAEISLGDALGRLQRDLEHDVVAARDFQLADRPPLLHRRRDRTRVNDAPHDLLVDAARDQE